MYPNTFEAFICDETAETRLQQDELKSQVEPPSFCDEIERNRVLLARGLDI